MNALAGMPAQLFERSNGLSPEREVSNVWFEERGGAPDELLVRVAHVRGRAVGCPECGRLCILLQRCWRLRGVLLVINAHTG